MVVGDAGEIDHVLAFAAAGQADIGLACFAGAIDNAAEHRERHRGIDVLQAFFERLHRADDIKALSCATGA